MYIIVVLLIVGVVVYAHFQEGILTALGMAFNVLFAGLLAFSFFEPVADELAKWFDGTLLEGFEDGLALSGVFAAVFAALKAGVNNVADSELELHPLFQQLASILVAAVAGYFLAGFLLCMLATLPVGQKILGYDPTAIPDGETTLANYFPPDRLWLATMNRLGRQNLSWGPEAVTFDPDGTFSLRYKHLRRYDIPDAP